MLRAIVTGPTDGRPRGQIGGVAVSIIASYGSGRGARFDHGSSNRNTRPNVSCDGIPFGRARNVRNQAAFVSPNVAAATRSSAPQITAHSLIVRMSTSNCS
jgi:hypothetical protein